MSVQSIGMERERVPRKFSGGETLSHDRTVEPRLQEAFASIYEVHDRVFVLSKVSIADL